MTYVRIKDVYPNAGEDKDLSEEEQIRRDRLIDRFDKAVNQFEEDLKPLYAELGRITALVRQTEQSKAEEHGVPVGTARSGKYVPKSMKDIFGDGEKVDEVFLDEITHYDYGSSLLPVGSWWVTSNTCF